MVNSVFIRKSIALIVSLVMIGESCVYAQPDVYSVRIPEDKGYITSLWNGSDSSRQPQKEKTVILIEDAHDRFDVQKNITDIILSFLPKKMPSTSLPHETLLVGVEGAQGLLSRDLFTDVPLKEARKEAALALVKQGYFSAAEAAVIGADSPCILWGIDDSSALRENSEVYKKVRKEAEGIDLFIAQKEAELKARVVRLSNDQFRMWAQHYINDMNERDTEKILPDLVAAASDMHCSYDDLVMVSLCLEQANPQNGTYPPKAMSVDVEQLNHETTVLMERVLYAYVQTKEEEAVYAALCAWKKVSQRFRLVATSEQDHHETTRHLLSSVAQCISVPERAHTWADRVDDFYKGAKIRDEYMVTNLIAAMDKYAISKAVAVVGGFHSKGMSRLLQNKGISYVVVRPKLNEHEEYCGYEARMQGMLPLIPSVVGSSPAAQHVNLLLDTICADPQWMNAVFSLFQDHWDASVVRNLSWASRLELLEKNPLLPDDIRKKIHALYDVAASIATEVRHARIPDAHLEEVLRARVVDGDMQNNIRSILFQDDISRQERDRTQTSIAEAENIMRVYEKEATDLSKKIVENKSFAMEIVRLLDAVKTIGVRVDGLTSAYREGIQRLVGSKEHQDVVLVALVFQKICALLDISREDYQEKQSLLDELAVVCGREIQSINVLNIIRIQPLLQLYMSRKINYETFLHDVYALMNHREYGTVHGSIKAAVYYCLVDMSVRDESPSPAVFYRLLDVSGGVLSRNPEVIGAFLYEQYDNDVFESYQSLSARVGDAKEWIERAVDVYWAMNDMPYEKKKHVMTAREYYVLGVFYSYLTFDQNRFYDLIDALMYFDEHVLFLSKRKKVQPYSEVGLEYKDDGRVVREIARGKCGELSRLVYVPGLSIHKMNTMLSSVLDRIRKEKYVSEIDMNVTWSIIDGTRFLYPLHKEYVIQIHKRAFTHPEVLYMMVKYALLKEKDLWGPLGRSKERIAILAYCASLLDPMIAMKKSSPSQFSEVMNVYKKYFVPQDRGLLGMYKRIAEKNILDRDALTLFKDDVVDELSKGGMFQYVNGNAEDLRSMKMPWPRKDTMYEAMKTTVVYEHLKDVFNKQNAFYENVVLCLDDFVRKSEYSLEKMSESFDKTGRYEGLPNINEKILKHIQKKVVEAIEAIKELHMMIVTIEESQRAEEQKITMLYDRIIERRPGGRSSIWDVLMNAIGPLKNFYDTPQGIINPSVSLLSEGAATVKNMLIHIKNMQTVTTIEPQYIRKNELVDLIELCIAEKKPKDGTAQLQVTYTISIDDEWLPLDSLTLIEEAVEIAYMTKATKMAFVLEKRGDEYIFRVSDNRKVPVSRYPTYVQNPLYSDNGTWYWMPLYDMYTMVKVRGGHMSVMGDDSQTRIEVRLPLSEKISVVGEGSSPLVATIGATGPLTTKEDVTQQQRSVIISGLEKSVLSSSVLLSPAEQLILKRELALIKKEELLSIHFVEMQVESLNHYYAGGYEFDGEKRVVSAVPDIPHEYFAPYYMYLMLSKLFGHERSLCIVADAYPKIVADAKGGVFVKYIKALIEKKSAVDTEDSREEEVGQDNIMLEGVIHDVQNALLVFNYVLLRVKGASEKNAKSLSDAFAPVSALLTKRRTEGKVSYEELKKCILANFDTMRKSFEQFTKSTMIQNESDDSETRLIINAATQILSQLDKICYWSGFSQDPCDMQALYTSLAKRYSHIQFSIEFQKDACRVVNTYTDILTEALFEIVKNADKYAFNPSVGEKRIAITVSESAEGEIVIRVKDNGKGMAEDQVARVFVYKDTQATDAAIGTGKGMAGVKSKIDAVMGRIECESEPGKGTEFTFALPNLNKPTQERIADTKRVFGRKPILNVCGLMGTYRKAMARKLASYYGLQYINGGFAVRAMLYLLLHDSTVSSQSTFPYDRTKPEDVARFIRENRDRINAAAEPLEIQLDRGGPFMDVSLFQNRIGRSLRNDIKVEMDHNEENNLWMHRITKDPQVKNEMQDLLLRIVKQASMCEDYAGIAIVSSDPLLADYEIFSDEEIDTIFMETSRTKERVLLTGIHTLQEKDAVTGRMDDKGNIIFKSTEFESTPGIGVLIPVDVDKVYLGDDSEKQLFTDVRQNLERVYNEKTRIRFVASVSEKIASIHKLLHAEYMIADAQIQSYSLALQPFTDSVSYFMDYEAHEKSIQTVIKMHASTLLKAIAALEVYAIQSVGSFTPVMQEEIEVLIAESKELHSMLSELLYSYGYSIKTNDVAKILHNYEQKYPHINFDISCPEMRIQTYSDVFVEALDSIIQSIVEKGFSSEQVNKHISISVVFTHADMVVEVKNNGHRVIPREDARTVFRSSKKKIEYVCGTFQSTMWEHAGGYCRFTLPVEYPSSAKKAAIVRGMFAGDATPHNELITVSVSGDEGTYKKQVAKRIATLFGFKYIDLNFILRTYVYLYSKDCERMGTRMSPSGLVEWFNHNMNRIAFTREPIEIDLLDNNRYVQTTDTAQTGYELRKDIRMVVDLNYAEELRMFRKELYEKGYVAQLVSKITKDVQRVNQHYPGVVFMSGEPLVGVENIVHIRTTASARIKRLRTGKESVYENRDERVDGIFSVNTSVLRPNHVVDKVIRYLLEETREERDDLQGFLGSSLNEVQTYLSAQLDTSVRVEREGSVFVVWYSFGAPGFLNQVINALYNKLPDNERNSVSIQWLEQIEKEGRQGLRFEVKRFDENRTTPTKRTLLTIKRSLETLVDTDDPEWRSKPKSKLLLRFAVHDAAGLLRDVTDALAPERLPLVFDQIVMQEMRSDPVLLPYLPDNKALAKMKKSELCTKLSQGILPDEARTRVKLYQDMRLKKVNISRVYVPDDTLSEDDRAHFIFELEVNEEPGVHTALRMAFVERTVRIALQQVVSESEVSIEKGSFFDYLTHRFQKRMNNQNEPVFTNDEVALIGQAIHFIGREKGLRRNKRELLLEHPVAVAELLMNECKVYDHDAILAALLHDSLEDKISLATELTNRFGPHLCKMAELLNKSGKNEREYYRNITRGVLSDDKNEKRIASIALLVKLVDRLHNLRSRHSDTSGDMWKTMRDLFPVLIGTLDIEKVTLEFKPAIEHAIILLKKELDIIATNYRQYTDDGSLRGGTTPQGEVEQWLSFNHLIDLGKGKSLKNCPQYGVIHRIPVWGKDNEQIYELEDLLHAVETRYFGIYNDFVKHNGRIIVYDDAEETVVRVQENCIYIPSTFLKNVWSAQAFEHAVSYVLLPAMASVKNGVFYKTVEEYTQKIHWDMTSYSIGSYQGNSMLSALFFRWLSLHETGCADREAENIKKAYASTMNNDEMERALFVYAATTVELNDYIVLFPSDDFSDIPDRNLIQDVTDDESMAQWEHVRDQFVALKRFLEHQDFVEVLMKAGENALEKGIDLSAGNTFQERNGVIRHLYDIVNNRICPPFKVFASPRIMRHPLFPFIQSIEAIGKTLNIPVQFVGSEEGAQLLLMFRDERGDAHAKNRLSFSADQDLFVREVAVFPALFLRILHHSISRTDGEVTINVDVNTLPYMCEATEQTFSGHNSIVSSIIAAVSEEVVSFIKEFERRELLAKAA